jgi:hypothetical protein
VVSVAGAEYALAKEYDGVQFSGECGAGCDVRVTEGTTQRIFMTVLCRVPQNQCSI